MKLAPINNIKYFGARDTVLAPVSGSVSQPRHTATPSTPPNRAHYNTVSFGISGRKRHTEHINCMDKTACSGVTAMFREDLHWINFVKFLGDHIGDDKEFQIINSGCSTGEEPYSLAMAFLKVFGDDAEKFFPIIARDNDEIVIKIAAEKGLVNMDESDLTRIGQYKINKDDYFKLSTERLEIPDDEEDSETETYEALPKLKKCIKFGVSDVFDDLNGLKDNSKTVLLFRNSLPYLSSEQVGEFLDKVDEKLGVGSVLELGEFGMFKSRGQVWKNLHKMGFESVHQFERGTICWPEHVFVRKSIPNARERESIEVPLMPPSYPTN